MQDERYPGFDVNPIISSCEFELLQGETASKLYDVGISDMNDLLAMQLEEVKDRALLSDAEFAEITDLVGRFSRQKIQTNGDLR